MNAGINEFYIYYYLRTDSEIVKAFGGSKYIATALGMIKLSKHGIWNDNKIYYGTDMFITTNKNLGFKVLGRAPDLTVRL